MVLKVEVIDKRKDILFAEIGALIHDLGKLSREFVEQTTQGNIFDHSLILGRDFRNGVLNKCGKSDSELDSIINEINRLGSCLKSSNINLILDRELSSILSGKSSRQKKGVKNEFLTLLKSKFSNFQFQTTFDFLSLFNIFGNLSIADIISKHHGNEKFNLDNLTEADERYRNLFSRGADGIDSAIDKMVAGNINFPKQRKDFTYISTAFGYEKNKIDLDRLKDIRDDYANKLYNILKELKNNPENVSLWITKRKELLNETRKAFLNTLGETRRPANDVTLWDHSFSVASLYKSALAEVIINSWKEPKDIKWKFLIIRFDGNSFYNSVPKIADVLGRKNLIKTILDSIKDVLEVVIPIGNEIYRDENGSVFLVPECAEDSKIFDIDNELWDKIKDIKFKLNLTYRGDWEEKPLSSIGNNPSTIKELIEKISSYISEGIFVPEISLSESSRGAVNLGEEINKIKSFKIYIERLEQEWNEKNKGYEKCTVCGLKPIPLTYKDYQNLKEKIKNNGWQNLSEDEKNNFKAYERKVCDFCLRVAENRVAEWHNNKKWKEEHPEKPSFDTTIWLDEVADENNRIALIYLSFDLEKWLNGEMLNTFLSKPLLEGKFETDKTKNINNYTQWIDLLKEAFDKNDFGRNLSIQKDDGNDLTAKELFQTLGCYISHNNPQELFRDIVEIREQDWQDKYPVPQNATKGDKLHKAYVFLLFMTRKHPSFARIRRIWETTRIFGIEAFKIAKEILNKKERIVFRFKCTEELKITHTYWFKDREGKKQEFVVVDGNHTNKEYTAVVITTDKKESISNGLILYDEKFENEYGAIEHIIQIQDSERDNKYSPIIPFQIEPQRTMFFVPLKDSWEIIECIKKQYEINFSKVQDRLPLKLGFVAFHKRTPMYAVLDAANRLASKKIEPEIFTVCDITELNSEKYCALFAAKLGNKVKKISLSSGNKKFSIFVSYSTGDPEKEDLFHPYFIVENNNGWKVPLNKAWKAIKHVKYVQKNDKIIFYPSYFDFIWLDTNVRRLDAGKRRKHWLFKKASPKPYLLQEMDYFERLKTLIRKLGLTNSQLLNAYELLISKLQEWELTDKLPIEEAVFKEFVENVILNIPFRLKIKEETKKGEISSKDFKFLKQTILSGIFFDFIDMWHTVLKRKFEEEHNE